MDFFSTGGRRRSLAFWTGGNETVVVRMIMMMWKMMLKGLRFGVNACGVELRTATCRLLSSAGGVFIEL